MRLKNGVTNALILEYLLWLFNETEIVGGTEVGEID